MGAFIRNILTAGIIIGLVSFATNRCTWNRTPSEPRGLYLLLSGPPAKGDFVTFSVPPALRTLVRGRQYLPPTYQLLKRIVAVAGDHVCINDRVYAVNNQVISSVAHVDAAGRSLVPVTYCGEVPQGHAFVASPPPSSLDSRYFGALPLDGLKRAYPLWTY